MAWERCVYPEFYVCSGASRRSKVNSSILVLLDSRSPDCCAALLVLAYACLFLSARQIIVNRAGEEPVGARLWILLTL